MVPVYPRRYKTTTAASNGGPRPPPAPRCAQRVDVRIGGCGTCDRGAGGGPGPPGRGLAARGRPMEAPPVSRHPARVSKRGSRRFNGPVEGRGCFGRVSPPLARRRQRRGRRRLSAVIARTNAALRTSATPAHSHGDRPLTGPALRLTSRSSGGDKRAQRVAGVREPARS